MDSKPQAVFFDAGGTLLHPHPSVGEIYARTALKHGIHMDGARIQAGFLRAFRTHASVRARRPASESGERQFWRRVVWDTVGGTRGVPQFDAYLEDLYDVMGRAESWRLYPDCLPALEALQGQGLRLGLISNWDRRLIKTLEGLGLSRFFRAVFISSLEGVSKPDPRIFHMAARRMGLPPAHCMHIGDSLRDDLHGAQAAGMKGLLIQREGLRPPGDFQVLGSLLETCRFL
jgi:putative hydrolase of the HAD superfamily